MADRITRPTVVLLGGLPDGNLSSMERHGDRLLGTDPPDVYALSLMTRKTLAHDDDNDGAETAKVKVRAIETFPAGTFPFDVHAGETVADVLDRLRTERTGESALPVATPREAAEHDAAVMQLRDWAAANLDEGTNALAALWNDYFGGRSPSGPSVAWRDAPTQMIREFLLAKGEEIAAGDPEAGKIVDAGPEESAGDQQPAEPESRHAEIPPGGEPGVSVPTAAFTEPGGPADAPPTRRRGRSGALAAVQD